MCLPGCLIPYDHEAPAGCAAAGEPRVPPPDAPPEVWKAWDKYRRTLDDAARLARRATDQAAQFIPCTTCNRAPWEGCQCLPF